MVMYDNSEYDEFDNCRHLYQAEEWTPDGYVSVCSTCGEVVGMAQL